MEGQVEREGIDCGFIAVGAGGIGPYFDLSSVRLGQGQLVNGFLWLKGFPGFTGQSDDQVIGFGDHGVVGEGAQAGVETGDYSGSGVEVVAADYGRAEIWFRAFPDFAPGGLEAQASFSAVRFGCGEVGGFKGVEGAAHGHGGIAEQGGEVGGDQRFIGIPEQGEDEGGLSGRIEIWFFDWGFSEIFAQVKAEFGEVQLVAGDDERDAVVNQAISVVSGDLFA